MSLPELLESALDGEPSVAEVQLGGEDVLVVTPSRTVVYRADGLLSDESIESYPHEAEEVDLSVGRRKAKLTLDYGLDGSETLAFPAKRVEKVLHPILAGVISAAGITEAGETVHKTFRFSDLTLIVTSKRVIKHIGSAVWDTDFEAFEYSGLTDVDFEEGSVATSIVLTHNGRQNRFKTPNSDARAVREAIVEAVCEFHGVTSIQELREAMASQEDGEGVDPESADRLDFGNGPDPLSAEPGELDSQPTNATQTESDTSVDEGLAASLDETNSQSADGSQPTEAQSADQQAETQPTDTAQRTDQPQAVVESSPNGEQADAETFDAFEGSPFESAGPVDEDDISAQIAALAEKVDQQERQLARQAELIETLIEELRRGR
ncbi:MAG: PH domain-containing protein [Euryarchaeota archaeon]|nr:PH domain-containing protein [Euryarchaeota archaeon]